MKNTDVEHRESLEELLEKIYVISLDYDGYRTAPDLMSLIDELSSYTKDAQRALLDGVLFREQTETVPIQEGDIVIENGEAYTVYNNGNELCYNNHLECDIDYDYEENSIETYMATEDYVAYGDFSCVLRKIGSIYVPVMVAEPHEQE